MCTRTKGMELSEMEAWCLLMGAAKGIRSFLATVKPPDANCTYM